MRRGRRRVAPNIDGFDEALYIEITSWKGDLVLKNQSFPASTVPNR
jgi:hypothetical protein